MEVKNRRIKWIGILGCFLVILGLAFWFVRTDSTREKHIVLIVKSMDKTTDFWTSMIDGANMAAKEHEVHLTIMGPESETKYEEQGAMIEEAIRMKPDAIALVPASYTKTASYAEKIEKSDIKLMLVDSVMEEAMGSCIVATDNVEAGRKMGDFIKENAEDIRGIGVVGHVQGSSTATERELGLRNGLEEYEDKIVDVVFCDSNYNKAYKITKEMLEKHPEINVLAGLNEYSSVGAARAVIDLGLEGKIFMVGFDSSIKEVDFLESGIFQAIVVQKPLNMGYLAIENTIKLLENEMLPQYIDSGSAIITKETMYMPENQKLLFPI